MLFLGFKKISMKLIIKNTIIFLSMKYLEDVQKILDRIPKEKVMTYQQIAIMLGNKKLARVVGNTLHKNPLPLVHPCYKVVNSKGQLAKNFGYGGIEKQKEMLENDGIKVIDYKVDLDKYKWKV